MYRRIGRKQSYQSKDIVMSAVAINIIRKNRQLRVRRNVLALTFCVASSLLIIGCGSQKAVVEVPKPVQETPSAKVPDEAFTVKTLDKTAKRLIEEGLRWIGVPYKYGGNDMAGVDCSGFVLQIFLTTTDIKLPRNSAEQHKFCAYVKKEELTEGDLVFFSSGNSGGKVAHVGMYIGNGCMVHASSSQGVTITPLDNPYFLKHFVSAGRVPGLNKTFSPVEIEEEKENVKAVDIVKRAFGKE